MAKQTRKVNTIKNGTIELVLLLLLQTNKKYGYQLAQEMSELSNGKYELKEADYYGRGTMKGCCQKRLMLMKQML